MTTFLQDDYLLGSHPVDHNSYWPQVGLQCHFALHWLSIRLLRILGTPNNFGSNSLVRHLPNALRHGEVSLPPPSPPPGPAWLNQHATPNNVLMTQKLVIDVMQGAENFNRADLSKLKVAPLPPLFVAAEWCSEISTWENARYIIEEGSMVNSQAMERECVYPQYILVNSPSLCCIQGGWVPLMMEILKGRGKVWK
jgi:hypothetical protein